MLPTIPKESAIMLCTAPMIVPHQNLGMIPTATIKNIREKDVPIPPGICRASVRTFAAGAMSLFEKSPRSQHSAIMIRRRILSWFIIDSFSKRKAQLFPAAPRLNDHGLCFRSSGSELVFFMLLL